MGDFQPVLNTILGAGIVGIVTWVWALWKSHNELRLKIAEDYPKSNSVKEIVTQAIAPIERELAAQARESLRQGRILEAIARQMHIPTALED